MIITWNKTCKCCNFAACLDDVMNAEIQNEVGGADQSHKRSRLPLYFKEYACYGDMDLVVAKKCCHQYEWGEGFFSIEHSAAVVLCKSGELKMQDQENVIHLVPGSLFIVNPETTLKVNYCSADFDVTVIVISTEFAGTYNTYRKSVSMSDLFVFFSQHTTLQLSAEEVAIFENVWQLIKQTINLENNKFQQEMLHSFCFSIFMLLSGLITEILQSTPIVLNRNDELMNRFLKLLKEDYRVSHQLTYYADKLYVSPKYLSVVSCKCCGVPAGKIITRFLIRQAKRLLQESNVSIWQISDNLGFPNQSTFGKYFKKETGISPSQFRSNLSR